VPRVPSSNATVMWMRNGLRTRRRTGQWFTVGRDGGDTHYSPLSLINAGNVAGLGFAWEYKTNTRAGWQRRR